MPKTRKSSTSAKAAPQPVDDQYKQAKNDKFAEQYGKVEITPPAPKPNLPVVYDKLGIEEYSTASERGPIKPDDWKVLLGWETEKEWRARMVHEKGGKPEHWLFGETGPKREDNGQFQPIHCTNRAGEKVVCWANPNNRSFDMPWCEDLIHTHLHGQWAGPYTIPGETVNGETVRIGRYGNMLSGQHTGTACILADEYLQESRAQARNAAYPKYPFWNGQEHVFTETILITGVSEDERVLRTIDYVKPRKVEDMLYTMELFRSNTPAERKEMTRILASAIDMLWQRTATQGYKTHSEVVEFLKRHKRLLKCAEHIFVENGAKTLAPDGGRRITRLRIQPGMAAALCYLMGCGTDKTTAYSDEYRNESPPSERNLDWGFWDRAREFWAGLASEHSFVQVRTALNRLVESSVFSEDNQGLGGRFGEKLAILAKAWEIFRDHPESSGPPFNDDDLAEGGALSLSYTNLGAPKITNSGTTGGDPLPEGQIRLIDTADFEGIDCPGSLSKSKVSRRGEPAPPPPTQEQIYGAGGLAEQAIQRREEQEDKERAKRAARK